MKDNHSSAKSTWATKTQEEKDKMLADCRKVGEHSGVDLMRLTEFTPEEKEKLNRSSKELGLDFVF